MYQSGLITLTLPMIYPYNYLIFMHASYNNNLSDLIRLHVTFYNMVAANEQGT